MSIHGDDGIEIVEADDGDGPRARTLVIFGIGLIVMIVGIILIAALIGS